MEPDVEEVAAQVAIAEALTRRPQPPLVCPMCGTVLPSSSAEAPHVDAAAREGT